MSKSGAWATVVILVIGGALGALYAAENNLGKSQPPAQETRKEEATDQQHAAPQPRSGTWRDLVFDHETHPGDPDVNPAAPMGDDQPFIG